MFNNAHHFNIDRIDVSTDDGALRDLCGSIAAGAVLNSSERSDAPKCHPETRVAVQQDIYSWIADDGPVASPRARFLWLTGPAGSGKTTIMNTVGERFKTTGKLAAAFFFSSFSGSQERRSKGRFVTTLAYQLIKQDALQGLREDVLCAIRKDPAIFKMSLEEQMQALVLEPIRRCKAQWLAASIPQVILVDGLDECGGIITSEVTHIERSTSRLSRESDQLEILRILLDAVSDPAFPFLIVIASRPEPTIQNFFSTDAELQTTTIFLDNKYDPDADIQLFFNSHFARLRRQHAHLTPSWPGEGTVATLVKNASQQMIYAATVVRFLDTPSNPVRVQLEIILNDNPPATSNSSNPFEPLDSLYSNILVSTPNPVLIIKWLKAYHHLHIQPGESTLCFNHLCESTQGEMEHLFANMSALVRFSGGETSFGHKYIFYHKSFQDFLRDESRYGAFFSLTDEEARAWLVDRFIRLFEDCRPAVPLTVFWNVWLFDQEFLKLWYMMIKRRESFDEPYDDRLVQCYADYWTRRIDMRDRSGRAFSILMFVISHNKCRPFLPCLQTCKRWRKLIFAEWESAERQDSVLVKMPGWFTLLLDRFGIRRIPLRSADFAITLFHDRRLEGDFRILRGRSEAREFVPRRLRRDSSDSIHSAASSAATSCEGLIDTPGPSSPDSVFSAGVPDSGSRDEIWANEEESPDW